MFGRLGVTVNTRLRIGATHATALYAVSMVAGIGLTGSCRLGTCRLHTAPRLILLQGLGTGSLLQGIPTCSLFCATIARQWTWIGSGCGRVLGSLPRTGVLGTWRRCINGSDREHDHGHGNIYIYTCSAFLYPHVFFAVRRQCGSSHFCNVWRAHLHAPVQQKNMAPSASNSNPPGRIGRLRSRSVSRHGRPRVGGPEAHGYRGYTGNYSEGVPVFGNSSSSHEPALPEAGTILASRTASTEASGAATDSRNPTGSPQSMGGYAKAASASAVPQTDGKVFSSVKAAIAAHNARTASSSTSGPSRPQMGLTLTPPPPRLFATVEISDDEHDELQPPPRIQMHSEPASEADDVPMSAPASSRLSDDPAPARPYAGPAMFNYEEYRDMHGDDSDDARAVSRRQPQEHAPRDDGCWKMPTVMFGLCNKGGPGKAGTDRAYIRTEDMFDSPSMVLGCLELAEADVKDLSTWTAVRVGLDKVGGTRWVRGELWHGCCVLVRAKHCMKIETLERGAEVGGSPVKISRFIVYKITFEGTIFDRQMNEVVVILAHLNNVHGKKQPQLVEKFNSKLALAAFTHKARILMADYNMRAESLADDLAKQPGLLTTVLARHCNFDKLKCTNNIQAWSGHIAYDSDIMIAFGPHYGVRRISDRQHALAGAVWPQSVDRHGSQHKCICAGYPADAYISKTFL